MEVQVFILNRADAKIKTSVLASGYEINRDYLTNEKSTFSLAGAYDATEGDFLLAKTIGNKEAINLYQQSTIAPLYFGVIDSFENGNIIACDLYHLVQFDFPATRKTGNSFEAHVEALLRYYLLSDSSKLAGVIEITRDPTINTPHSYQPDENPTATKLTDYLINGFKKYNVTWEVVDVYYDTTSAIPQLKIKTAIRKKTATIQLKNNAYAFLNWDVYVTTVGRNTENKLLIVEKGMTNSEAPKIRSTWYLTTDNQVTQSMNDEVYKPTKTKVAIYDPTATDNPTYQEIAKSELTGNYYAHEISFDLAEHNELLPVSRLEIGLLAKIVYDQVLYNSVLTGYLIRSDTDVIHLRFGHVRSKLSEILL